MLSSPELIGSRLSGLAHNPSAPGDILVQLVIDPRVAQSVLYRHDLPSEVYEAALSSPDREVRRALAVSPTAPGGLRARLVQDPALAVRAGLVDRPFPLWSTQRMPDEAYRRLAENLGPTFLPEVAAAAPPLVLAELARDPRSRPAVLQWAQELPAELCDELIGDPDLQVRREAMLWAVDRRPELVPVLLDLESPPASLVATAELTRERAERLARHPSVEVRAAAAANPSLPADLVTELATDEPQVVVQVSMRPELTDQQRLALGAEVRWDTRAPEWVRTTDDPVLVERCVASAHLPLRRAVTANPHLTADQVARLATDEDPDVRLFLCESRDDVPGEALLEVYLNVHRLRPFSLHLKVADANGRRLAHLADHDDPRARALVMLDPEAPAELIERLSRDPAGSVRSAAAADPRLPLSRILELLDDPEAARGAAANPELPQATMRKLLSDAELPREG